MTKKLLDLFRAKAPKNCVLHKMRPEGGGYYLYVFDDLDAVVDDWIMRFGAKGANRMERDTCVEHCMAAYSLDEAVMRACASLRTNGKLHNHQSRVRKQDRDYFAVHIMRHGETVRLCHTFDELYDFLNEVKPSGIGPVTVYDVATRIAAYLQLPITSLYLHAGVQVGWNILHGGRGHTGGVARKGDVARVPKLNLPKALQRLPCDEVEDMLCCYRDYLKPWCAPQYKDMVPMP